MEYDIYLRCAHLIICSSMTVVLTGAGISTESGIPDFRSQGSGLYEKIDPMECLSRDVLYNNPAEFYSTGFEILSSMRGAQPNDAHLLLSRMESEGLIHSIITQNIDNLHYKAGSRNILEVHGNTRSGYCVNCGSTIDFEELTNMIEAGVNPPMCLCGGLLRPDVVLFGDNLPDCFNTAWEITRQCDLMVVIGSSLQVSPVNYLPGFAEKLIIINMGETTYDDKADIVCNDKASHALMKIYSAIQEIKENER